MPRGVPLTPAQLAKAADVYASTGNYSEAARAVEADVSALRRQLIAHEEPDRTKLHARAIDAGMRRGRKRLALVIELGDGRLRAAVDPKGFAMVANAIARATEALHALSEKRNRDRQARLTREKTRAEIEVLKAKARGDLPPDVTITATDPTAVDALIRKHFGQAGAKAKTTDAPAPDSDRSAGGGPVAGDAAPVPGAMGSRA